MMSKKKKKSTLPEDGYNQITKKSHVRMLPKKYLPDLISLGILYFHMMLVKSKQNLIIYFHALIAKS